MKDEESLARGVGVRAHHDASRVGQVGCAGKIGCRRQKGGGLRSKSLFRMVIAAEAGFGYPRQRGEMMSWCALRFAAIPCRASISSALLPAGRGVTVHTVGCPTVMESDPHRKIEVSWEESGQPPRPVKIEVTCVDQPGLLAAISAAITSAEANIARAQIRTFSGQKALNTFEVMIKNSQHLKDVLQNISKVKGVYKAVRARGRTVGRADRDQAQRANFTEEGKPVAQATFCTRPEWMQSVQTRARLTCPSNFRPHPFKVGPPRTFGFIVGMADVVTDGAPFPQIEQTRRHLI